MTIRMRRPRPADLASLAERSRDEPFTYRPIGVTDSDVTPPGHHRDRWTRVLGQGDRTFDLAAEAIMTWGVQRGAGLVVLAHSPVEAGAIVVMSAPLPIGWVDVACRVIRVIDETDRSGFVYGTLAEHPEQGEESFVVVRDTDGTVTFEVVAVSRPRHPLARLAPPAARLLQRRAVDRYLDAMTDAVRS
ncbi:MAG: DUF1990 domain-containing protein [Ilumatobacteraceae bacterium]